jgi:hypothetical protein
MHVTLSKVDVFYLTSDGIVHCAAALQLNFSQAIT